MQVRRSSRFSPLNLLNEVFVICLFILPWIRAEFAGNHVVTPPFPRSMSLSSLPPRIEKDSSYLIDHWTVWNDDVFVSVISSVPWTRRVRDCVADSSVVYNSWTELFDRISLENRLAHLILVLVVP